MARAKHLFSRVKKTSGLSRWKPSSRHGVENSTSMTDADSAYHRAITAGATSMEPPLDTPYGDRRAMVRDSDGNVFQIAHRRVERS